MNERRTLREIIERAAANLALLDGCGPIADDRAHNAILDARLILAEAEAEPEDHPSPGGIAPEDLDAAGRLCGYLLGLSLSGRPLEPDDRRTLGDGANLLARLVGRPDLQYPSRGEPGPMSRA